MLFTCRCMNITYRSCYIFMPILLQNVLTLFGCLLKLCAYSGNSSRFSLNFLCNFSWECDFIVTFLVVCLIGSCILVGVPAVVNGTSAKSAAGNYLER